MKAIFRSTKTLKDWVLNLSPQPQTQPQKRQGRRRYNPKVRGFQIQPTFDGLQRGNDTESMDKSGITNQSQSTFQEDFGQQVISPKKSVNLNRKPEHERANNQDIGKGLQPQPQKSTCIDKFKQVELRNYFPQWQWYQKQLKLTKGLIISAFLIFIGLIVGLTVWLTTRCWSDCQPQYRQGLIVYKDEQFLLTQGTHSDLNHDSRIILSETKKAQSIVRSTESVLRNLWASDNSQKWIFSVRIFAILENLSNSQKHQQIYKDWLEEYNKNPRKMIDLLVKTIKENLVKPGTQKWGRKIPDNIIIESFIEQTLIDIRYDPFLERFVTSTFQENGLEIIDFDEGKDRIYYKKEKQNLKSENKTAESTDKKSKKNDKSDLTNEINQAKSRQQLLAKVMRQTVYYIKRVAARNIEALKAQSEKLMSYQRSIIDQNKQLQKWEKTLIQDCRSIQMLKFRCRIDAAMELIPELTMEKLMQPGSNYIISQNLQMVFKEVKIEQTESQGNV